MTKVVPTVIVPIIYNEKIPWYWEQALNAVGSVLEQTVRPELIVSVEEDHATAKNRGVERADTEWCMFLDADDTLHPKFIEHLEVEDGKVGLLKPQCYINGVYISFPTADLLERNFLINSCVFRKEVYERVGGADNRPYPDWFLWSKMLIEEDMEIQEVESQYNYLKTNVGINNRNTQEDVKRTKEDIEAYAKRHGRNSLVPTTRKEF